MPKLNIKCKNANLSVVDLLFEGVVRDEAVDVRDLFLSVSVDPTDGLTVVTRVPRRVENDDAIGTDQVDAQALKSKQQKCLQIEELGKNLT